MSRSCEHLELVPFFPIQLRVLLRHGSYVVVCPGLVNADVPLTKHYPGLVLRKGMAPPEEGRSQEAKERALITMCRRKMKRKHDRLSLVGIINKIVFKFSSMEHP